MIDGLADPAHFGIDHGPFGARLSAGRAVWGRYPLDRHGDVLRVELGVQVGTGRSGVERHDLCGDMVTARNVNCHNYTRTGRPPHKNNVFSRRNATLCRMVALGQGECGPKRD
ncbi:hypothetical protein Bbelb_429850 [Branchiostoma belcheri]|nr:hypothetical protein Bbelb_429850 [Branchiostoma belcheri]